MRIGIVNQQQLSIGSMVPIFRWGEGSSAIDAALAEQERTKASLGQQRHDFDQEVLHHERLNLLGTQVAVAAKADPIATRRFDVAKDRYMIGKIDVPNLFLAQSEKNSTWRANIQTL